MVNTSRRTSPPRRLNVDKLLEKILLEAEILDLKANPDRHASGTVIEASPGQGTWLCDQAAGSERQHGSGDVIVAGEFSGRESHVQQSGARK